MQIENALSLGLKLIQLSIQYVPYLKHKNSQTKYIKTCKAPNLNMYITEEKDRERKTVSSYYQRR